jgi:hypothetical protein
MHEHQKSLLALAVTLLIATAGLSAYMTGPARMIASPPLGAEVGFGMLDTCFCGYTQQDVDIRLQTWSRDQIALYRQIHLGPDLVFPWVYTGFFFVTALLTFGCASPRLILWPWLLILPVFNLAADYVENYLISFVILPAGLPSDAGLVAWASRATVLKWALVALNVIMTVAGIALWVRSRCLGQRVATNRVISTWRDSTDK